MKKVCMILIFAFAAGMLAAGTDIAGGRIAKTTGGYDVSYFIIDHLGSTRATVNDNGDITAQYNYYPFGKIWESAGTQAPTTRYLFSGKERQTVRDLGYFDFGARMYDSNTGRWFVTDPMAEKYYSISPYAYCLNNPVNYIDPNGMWVENSGDESSDSDDDDDGMQEFLDWVASIFANYGLGGGNDGITYPIFGGTEHTGEGADGLYGGELEPAVCTARAPLSSAQINYIVENNMWGYIRSTRLTQDEMAKVGIAIVHKGHQKFFESPETQRAITYLSLIAPVAKGVSVIGNIIRTGAKFLAKQAVKSGGKYSDDLVKAAQKLYPKKAGKIEMHHITPKYLGGTKNGPLVPLDGAYHQQITNAFRHVWSYGKAPINEIQRKQIMEQVYKQFPLPFGYPF